MDYFCVDIESSGPVPGIHNLLSFGVTHVRRTQGAYRMFNDLYLEVQPVFPKFEPAAMAINRLDADRLKLFGVPPKEAMTKLVAWVKGEQRSAKERPVFVAHNAPFDWMFCAYYFGWAELENPFGHSAIDTKALAMGKLDLAWSQTSLKSVAALLPGVSARDASTLHHAGADARYQAEVFAALMNHVRA